MNDLESWLVEWGYRTEIVKLEFHRMYSIDSNAILAKRPKRQEDSVICIWPSLACDFGFSNIVKLFLQKQPPEVFCKKGVLENFTKFTGKHLCQSLFFNWYRCFPVAKFIITSHWRLFVSSPFNCFSISLKLFPWKRPKSRHHIKTDLSLHVCLCKFIWCRPNLHYCKQKASSVTILVTLI